MLRPQRTLTILDPTSLLGREVTEGIARAFPDVPRRLFHTGADPEHLIAEVSGEATLVAPLLDPDELDGSVAVILTSSPHDRRSRGRLLTWLRANPSVALLDCTQPGVAGDEAVCVLDSIPAVRRDLPWYHLVDPSLLRRPCAGSGLCCHSPPRPSTRRCSARPPTSAPRRSRSWPRKGRPASRGKRRADLPISPRYSPSTSRWRRPSAPRRSRPRSRSSSPPSTRPPRHRQPGCSTGTLATVLLRCARDVPLERARALLRATPGLRLARRNETRRRDRGRRAGRRGLRRPAGSRALRDGVAARGRTPARRRRRWWSW